MALRAGGLFGQILGLSTSQKNLFQHPMKYGACSGLKIKMPLFFKRWQTQATIAERAEHAKGYMYAVLVANY
tara:strand:+ start:1761 stop:1976 length:216 start_codon:yes stop_codon:yes gene_type:complete